MADHSRLNAVVASPEDVLDQLQSFLTAAGPGPAWTEDGTFTNAANPGHLLVQSVGATPFFIYFKTVTISGVDAVQVTWWDGTGWGGAGAPVVGTLASTANSLVIEIANGYNFLLSMFASDDRVIIALKAVQDPASLGGTPYNTALSTQVVYAGGYTPHCDAADDLYPMVVAANAGVLVSSVFTDLDSANFPAGERIADPGFFPSSIAKTWGAADDPAVIATTLPLGAVALRLPSDAHVPLNNRGAEGFGFTQEVQCLFPGREESFTLVGVIVANAEFGYHKTVTFNAVNHYALPAFLRIMPELGRLGGTYPNKVLLVLQGTNVP